MERLKKKLNNQKPFREKVSVLPKAFDKLK